MRLNGIVESLSDSEDMNFPCIVSLTPELLMFRRPNLLTALPIRRGGESIACSLPNWA
jgi:hypothetical protein